MLISTTIAFAGWTSALLFQELPPVAPPQSPPWTWSVSAYTLDPPDESAYTSTIVRADKGSLHLEGRYGYEDRDTGSLWVGKNFAWPGEVAVTATPMIGAVGGDTDGLGLGVLFDAAWKRFDWYVESEYLFDFDDSDDDYLYTWSELTFAPSEMVYFGIVAQRTRVYDTDLEVDRGLLLGIGKGPVSATIYWFNIDRDDPYGALTLGFAF